MRDSGFARVYEAIPHTYRLWGSVSLNHIGVFRLCRLSLRDTIMMGGGAGISSSSTAHFRLSFSAHGWVARSRVPHELSDFCRLTGWSVEGIRNKGQIYKNRSSRGSWRHGEATRQLFQQPFLLPRWGLNPNFPGSKRLLFLQHEHFLL